MLVADRATVAAAMVAELVAAVAVAARSAPWRQRWRWSRCRRPQLAAVAALVARSRRRRWWRPIAAAAAAATSKQLLAQDLDAAFAEEEAGQLVDAITFNTATDEHVVDAITFDTITDEHVRWYQESMPDSPITRDVITAATSDLPVLRWLGRTTNRGYDQRPREGSEVAARIVDAQRTTRPQGKIRE